MAATSQEQDHSKRDERQFGSTSHIQRKRIEDSRDVAQTDRDRILYTSALRRLAGVTQVVSASEGHVFHNRLTHSLEVAQISRRLAERIARSRGVRVDPSVAEAAALAHDLGHPPFGHIAEETLDTLVKSVCKKYAGAEDVDGFEGNAQSFRIVTHLAAHRISYRGLNLSRAVLAGILKYPWLRGEGPDAKKSQKKYGAYRSESAALSFARDGLEPGQLSLEAQIMNFADDVAYSVHDVDDFFRARLLPLEDLSQKEHRVRELAAFKRSGKLAQELTDEQEEQLVGFIVRRFTFGRFNGTYDDRAGMRSHCSELIGHFMSGASVSKRGGVATLVRDPVKDIQMAFLQNLVWRHVIEGEHLARQQHGQIQVIRTLFETYFHCIVDAEKRSLREQRVFERRVIPAAFRAEVQALEGERDPRELIVRAARIAADIVAGYSDAQAHAIYRRVTGNALDHLSGNGSH